MATAAINGNVVTVDIDSTPPLRLDMSLQRHSYRHCGTAATAAGVNSLLHASVDDATIVAEALEVGGLLETLLASSKGKWGPLFGRSLTVTSGRTYLVDNSGLVPGAAPNHFFVTGGRAVWAGMTQAEFLAARDVRRVEDELQQRRTAGDTYPYLDAKRFAAKEAEPGPGGAAGVAGRGGAVNPVVRAVVAARVSIVGVDSTRLATLSGRGDIVALIVNRG
ncbi:hypothetical protein GCM10020229_35250 [Kitasatospora albolonga]|uniref:hypothetical protein n=1 Tax=Kitasatospora albolonga TaxID=68173 RepID=UPI0031E6AA03